MTEAQKAAIKRHGERLLAIYPQATITDPVRLYIHLRSLELRGSRLAEQRCNDSSLTEDRAEARGNAILRRARDILGFDKAGPAVFLNGDPRGYALKIESEAAKELAIEKDWGGYGIIAPEFNWEGF